MKVLFIESNPDIAIHLGNEATLLKMESYCELSYEEAASHLRIGQFDKVVTCNNPDNGVCAKKIIKFIKENRSEVGEPEIIIYSGAPEMVLIDIVYSSDYKKVRYLSKPNLEGLFKMLCEGSLTQ